MPVAVAFTVAVGECVSDSDCPSDDGVLYSLAPALTITADDKSRNFGDSNPAFTFSSSGFIDGDTAGTALTGSLITTAVPASNAGTFPITQGTLADNFGYTINFTNGTLTITGAVIAEPPVEPPEVAKLVEDLESPNNQSPVNVSFQRDSLVVSEQRYEMENLMEADIEDLMNMRVQLSRKIIKQFSLVESDGYLDFDVLNKMSLEDLMQIIAEPAKNLSNKLSFLGSQQLLEDELMLLMKPENLMQVKIKYREKIILEFSIVEPDLGFETY